MGQTLGQADELRLLELISGMLAHTRNALMDIDINLGETLFPKSILLMFPPHLSTPITYSQTLPRNRNFTSL